MSVGISCLSAGVLVVPSRSSLLRCCRASASGCADLCNDLSLLLTDISRGIEADPLSLLHISDSVDPVRMEANCEDFVDIPPGCGDLLVLSERVCGLADRSEPVDTEPDWSEVLEITPVGGDLSPEMKLNYADWW
jgi:hypothetical protein